MPELPEVETIRRGLAKTIIGKKIIKFESRDPKVVRVDPKEIENTKVLSIDRRAKMLIFNLNNEKSILIHLKMTGQLIWEACMGENEFCLKKKKGTSTSQSTTLRVAGGHPSPDWVGKLPNTYTRAIFYFDDNSVLFFNDLRRFGYLKLYKTEELKNGKELKNIGPEPLDLRSGQASSDFTVDYLMRRAAKIPNRKIKQFITDQEIIAGVGNIYVDEALFYADISPLRLVKDIKKSEWEKLRQSIIKSLELGLKYGGSSEDTYVDAFGNQGEMNKHVKVYRKTGQPCPAGCGGIVKRISLGGRGTHFCPECQK